MSKQAYSGLIWSYLCSNEPSDYEVGTALGLAAEARGDTVEQQVVRALAGEVERLNGRLTRALQALKEEKDALGVVWGEDVAEWRSELQRFKDREPSVRELQAWASQALEHIDGLDDPSHENYAVGHGVRDAIAAVRAFDLSPKDKW